MPRLNEERAQQVDASAGGREALEDGIYEVALIDVEAREGRVAPYWCWILEIPKDQNDAGRRFWHNTSLSPNAMWKVDEAFKAFGVPSRTDTDDLIGQRVRASITKQIIRSGKREGEWGNTVEALYPLRPEDAPDPGVMPGTEQLAQKVPAGAADEEPPF